MKKKATVKSKSVSKRSKPVLRGSNEITQSSGPSSSNGLPAKKAGANKKRTGVSPFPVVGIGGSAGGMEAFSTLLENLSPELGMVYIYIQHLSTKHDSLLPQILQRKTTMPVVKIKNGMVPEADHVYVIPANYLLSITDGKLKLTSLVKNNNPGTIDHFFHSLAEVCGHNAVGIVLSGTGADGTLGLGSIKTHGGVTFVQDHTAAYGSMPSHAADSGIVDFVMPPDKIAEELGNLIRQPYAVTTLAEFSVQHADTLRKIYLLLHNKKGVDFSYYKQTTIQRRILRRIALNGLNDLDSYLKLLNENKQEIQTLYHDLLISVTAFFRDPVLYEALSGKILPALFKNRRTADPVRIWIPGCATGEEAISFVITLLEFLGEKAISWEIQVFATDLNEVAIHKARSGIYSKTALENVSPERLRKYFVRQDGHYQVIKSIRDMCIFAPHNLLRNPPFSKMDIISCQNVLIYLEATAQNKIMHSFHYALKPTGYLLLGKSETIGTATNLFQSQSKNSKIFTRRALQTPLQLDFSTSVYPIADDQENGRDNSAQGTLKYPRLEEESDRLLLSRYVPAAVLVNNDLEILRFRGQTSRYLEPASGKASFNLLKMIREELAFDLRIVLQQARKEESPARKEGLIVNDGTTRTEISIEVVPLKTVSREPFYLIVFQETIAGGKEMNADLSPRGKSNTLKRVNNLENQLRDARENVRVLTEDFESAKEELQSANEEVLSSNEELQSINEELETSKEELQSTNEELTTINEELHTRNSELKEAGDYTQAIIETMHESLLMMTADLRVRHANKGFYKTFKVIPEETEGKYLFELGNNQWEIPELKRQLKMVQTRNIPFSNFEVTHTFQEIGKKSMLLNAQTFPVKDGRESMILLAIQDITERKEMENVLKESEERLRLLVQNASDIITVFDQDGTIKYESPAIETALGYKPEERVGRNINMDPIVHPDDARTKIALLKRSIDHPLENISGEFRLRHKDGSYRTFDAIFRNLLGDKTINGIIANYRDITERKILENHKDEFIGVASHELKTPVTSIKAYAQILEDIFLKAGDQSSALLLGKMNTQVDRLTNLIIDLLDFTRIEGGKLKFREEEYELNELVGEVVEDIQRTAPNHTITLKPGRSARISGDRYRTGQVLINLLNNAIKYSPGSKKILVNTTVKNNEVTVCVRDYGIGIDSSLQDKVFNRFFRVTESSLNTFPGLGLGLYIAAEFVKRQGGNIWVKSTKGKGSTFCFSIPLKTKK